LEIFVSQEVDLTIATLPEGLDPCDLLVARGPQPLLDALGGAVDALDFKLQRVLEKDTGGEGRRRAVDAVLGGIALAPEMTEQAGAVKRQLIVTRIAQRLALQEEIVWARLQELRSARRRGQRSPGEPGASATGGPSTVVKGHGRAAPEERELLEVLLA